MFEKKAIQEELETLEQNYTWGIVYCPASIKLIGCKWIFFFSIKLKFDGTLDRYKVRLVALDNKQEYGIDYDEVFALFAKNARTILAVVAFQS